MKRRSGLIFVISGPSGSGKTTLAKQLLRSRAIKGRLSGSVSFTTRPKRSKEREGRDYFFISRQQFLKLREKQKILEWTNFLGYYYGTPRERIDRQLKSGRSIVLCLDLKGARVIKRLYPEDAVTIFILPPSLAALRARVKRRCPKTDGKEVARRIRRAHSELSASRRYDYRLVNRVLKRAVKQLQEIVSCEINGKR
ncbi:guanylate kinase [Candidatus Omnitrophota bacterium]